MRPKRFLAGALFLPFIVAADAYSLAFSIPKHLWLNSKRTRC